MIFFGRAALPHYGEVINSWSTWLTGLPIKPSGYFNLLGALSLLALSIVYTLMLNVPLQPKSGKE